MRRDRHAGLHPRLVATDPALVQHLAAAGIPLEISRVSNVATGVCASGVTVTLHSDDPPMFDAWLAEPDA